ncbi:verrucotoxin subunit beta-like [Astyanax mexicanus]|uniref:Verrucotoxin subunit beta-like n=1 Tax=Astyanax mexicanus TaxID=7994 RepID=A0A8T2KPI0_ASTMX|nr:verrucotoxin subunit beta-like [Astyanax mexicanus]
MNIPESRKMAVHEQDLPNGLSDQTVITIRGQVKPKADKFSINLHKDNHIAFKFNPRFNEGGKQVIVRNSLIGNDWGSEERHLSYFPFKPGEPFEMKILCTHSEFRVKVDKKDLLSYRHRIREIDQIKKLTVQGDVLIRMLSIARCRKNDDDDDDIGEMLGRVFQHGIIHDVKTQLLRGRIPKDDDDFDIVEVAAMGRPFQLGMAYDLRKHTLIPGLTLWNHEKLQDKISISDQYDTKFNLHSSDKSEDETSNLKVNGSLKIAAKLGIVEFSGSGSYFTNNVKSDKRAKLTLGYHTTTKFKQLSMDHLTDVSYLSDLEETGATHVTVGILYGADAYFVFEKELKSDENKQEMEGVLTLKILNIPIFNVKLECEGSGEKKDSKTVKSDEIRCTFYGDFKLNTNPCTLEESLEVYKKLPDMLGENGEHAVPLQVWLYPLSKIPKAEHPSDCLIRELSDSLITRLSHAIDRLNLVEGKLIDLISDESTKSFVSFLNKLQDMKQKFSHYKADIMTKLAHLLPLIRGYKSEESDLEDLLKRHDDSVFNSTAMDQWLEYRKMELDVLRTFLRQLREVGVNLNEDLHILLSDADIKNVVSFTFTSLEEPDEFLSQLSDSDEEGKAAEIKTWLTRGIIKSMRKKTVLFKDLKKSNNSKSTKFTVSARSNPIISNPSATAGSEHHRLHPGACIMLYEDGSDEAICFCPPAKPVFSATYDINHSSITVRLSPACAATSKRTLEFKPRTKENWKKLFIHQDEVKLTELESDNEYEIRCSAMGILQDLPVTSDIISVRSSDNP